MLYRLEIPSRSRCEMIDVTSQVQELVSSSGVTSGSATLFVLHTTAALTVNEGADPDVRRDMIAWLERLVPRDRSFRHAEGNSDAHIKSSLLGPSLTLIVDKGRLLLGTWQAVYLCEFDGPRRRSIAVRIMRDGDGDSHPPGYTPYKEEDYAG